MVVRKRPQEHLHEVFSAHDVLESDPRDLYNLLRTCRTLYESSGDVARGRQLLSRFYIDVPGPGQQEPRLVRQIDSGKLHIFVVNPKWQHAREPALVAQVGFRGFTDSMISMRPQQPDGQSDVLVDMLSRQCLRWISAFVHWPFDNDPPAANSQLMSNLRQNFLGVTNFHQYDDNAGSGPDEDTRRYGTRFWAMICHCKQDTFLIIYNAHGTVWDRSFACPRVAMVAST